MEKTKRKTVETVFDSKSSYESSKASEKILFEIINNPNITINELSKKTGVTTRSIERNLQNLQNALKLKRVGSARGGYWQVMEERK